MKATESLQHNATKSKPASKRTPQQEIKRLKEVNKQLRKDLAKVEKVFFESVTWRIDAHCMAKDLIKKACEQLNLALIELDKTNKRPEVAE